MLGVIDGREEIKGHGRRDIPIWRAEFRAGVGVLPAVDSGQVVL